MQTSLQVELIRHTPEPEKLVAAAAKLCYSQTGIDQIAQGLNQFAIDNFLTMLGEIGHESPIEHVSFTFAVAGVSRSLLAQLTRHRLASYSVRSQRYVNEADFEYIIPPEIEAIPEAKALFSEAMQADQQTYEKLAALLAKNHVREFLQQGRSEAEARQMAEKKANEDARFVLPNACETKLVVTMNARSLHNFFRQRCCNRAQWEIRALATEMLKQVRTVAPALFKNAGPGCYSGGKCPEGKMTCGKTKEVKEFFSSF
ncbi:MAG: FAD-dependent thymidylate synthase [Syntrophomonadaceae bacterium]|nr:FAD-dependent thymidylate synthase [Syntrophomonadaceae bacterium]